MRIIPFAGAALALALAISPASAADPYSSSGGLKDGSFAPPPVYNWSGFYVGANVGGAWTQLDSSHSEGFSDGDYAAGFTINHTNEAIGAVGGGQIGYNFQTGGFVIGVEGDFGYLGVSQTRNIISAFETYPGGSSSLALGTRIEGGFLADITGRIGYASGPALFYVKGGWAYFDGTVGTSGINALAIMARTTDIRDVSASGLSGWTLGGGIEYLLNQSWSIKGEYQHFDFGSVDFHPVISDPTIVIGNTLTADVVKVGVNYHFGATNNPLK